MRPKHLAIILVLLALAVPAPPAHAGGVVSVCDEAHLRAALAGGGTVTFSCSGTITLTATLTIAADTSIDGSGRAVTISGNNTVRVFSVVSGVRLNMNSLIIANGGGGGDGGGGIFNHGGTVTVSNSTFSGNSMLSPSSYGGGIHNAGGTLIVSNSTFAGNRSWVGGGIYSLGTLTVSDSTFSGNLASNGGGISNAGTLIVSNSTFSGNGDGSGGGIEHAFGTATVSNSTFFGNRGYDGGGIVNYGSSRLSVSNSTFAGNRADHTGGGIANFGMLSVSNSTFSDNSAPTGGGILNSDGAVTLKNTIIANNQGGGNCAGAITDGGGNLSYPDTTCPGINGDPLLGALQNSLGSTQTMALGPGSAAIDAAIDAICAAAPVNNLDQRSIARPWGSHCDIGAVEQIPIKSIWLPAARAR